MAWYNAGTVSVTQNSATVTGSGTAWPDYVDAGQAFVGPDGLAYEIASVISATQLTLTTNYRGTTASGQAYRVMPVQGYLRDLAIQANQLLQSFASVRDGVGQGIFPAGTVGAPGFRFGGDEDTGLYRPGANLLGLVTNGTERLRIQAGGNVSIGTANDKVRLNLAGAANAAAPALGAASGSAFISGADNGYGLLIGVNAGDGASWLQAQRTDGTGAAYSLWLNPSGGNVGIGTTAPADKLHVAGGNLRVSSANAALHDSQLQFYVSGARRGYMYAPATGLAIGADSGNLQLGASGGAITAFGDNSNSLGTSSIRWSVVYAVTGVINTSDERAKQDIGSLPEEWLDAWGELEWVRYKFRDAVEAKGDGRWHVGLIAQHVRDVFAARDLDATEIGLLCYDEWEEEREPIMEERQIDAEIVIVDRVDTGLFDAEGNPVFRDVTEERAIMGMVDTGETRVTLEAGDRWGLRYDECQAMEAAWQRRELARKDAAIATLETTVATMAAQLAALSASSGD